MHYLTKKESYLQHDKDLWDNWNMIKISGKTETYLKNKHKGHVILAAIIWTILPQAWF